MGIKLIKKSDYLKKRIAEIKNSKMKNKTARIKELLKTIK